MEGFVDIDYYRKHPRKESLKRIMLDHQIVFKKQMSLMKGDSMFTRRELFSMKRTFIESHSVGSTQFVSDYSFSQEDFCSTFQQRPLDLRLSIGNSCDDGHLDDKEVNLSLSIGMSTYKRSRISTKSWKNKIVYPSTREIIDLEDSTETGSNEFLKNVVNSHQGSSIHCLNSDHSIGESPMNSDMHQEWGTFNQGSNGQRDAKQTILMDIDLNKDQPDESSFESNEPLGQYPSSDGSYGESCCQITSSLFQTPMSKQPKGQTSAKEGQSKIYSIDLESLPESDLTEEDTDYTVQEAALSLVSISLPQTSPNNQDSETKFRSNDIENIKENKKKPIPSSSLDSYESLVLKLEESSVDEDSATSKAFEFNEFDQKENGIKLRRGRRLKDFQKDILPTLSSLSKHEIWEDIKILECVIRSREYKRLNKAKTCKAENWSTPVKSKRSKVSYISPKKKREL